MKNKAPLYIVRGTGYGLDGTLVKVDGRQEIGDEVFFFVSPATNRPSGHESVLVNEKYLQEFGQDRLSTYTYTLTVSKLSDADGKMEQDFLVIDGAYRNLSVQAILNRFSSELGPILRLE